MNETRIEIQGSSYDAASGVLYSSICVDETCHIYAASIGTPSQDEIGVSTFTKLGLEPGSYSWPQYDSATSSLFVVRNSRGLRSDPRNDPREIRRINLRENYSSQVLYRAHAFLGAPTPLGSTLAFFESVSVGRDAQCVPLISGCDVRPQESNLYLINAEGHRSSALGHVFGIGRINQLSSDELVAWRSVPDAQPQPGYAFPPVEPVLIATPPNGVVVTPIGELERNKRQSVTYASRSLVELPMFQERDSRNRYLWRVNSAAREADGVSVGLRHLDGSEFEARIVVLDPQNNHVPIDRTVRVNLHGS